MSIPLPNMRGQKVLITGGLGFIGSNLAHKCLELGAKATIFSYKPASLNLNCKLGIVFLHYVKR